MEYIDVIKILMKMLMNHEFDYLYMIRKEIKKIPRIFNEVSCDNEFDDRRSMIEVRSVIQFAIEKKKKSQYNLNTIQIIQKTSF